LPGDGNGTEIVACDFMLTNIADTSGEKERSGRGENE
jgi:hypothetical protein